MKRPSRIFQDEKGFYIMYNKQRIELTVKDIKENKIRGALIKLYESNKTKIKHKKTGVAIYGKRRRGRIEEQHKAVQPLIDRKTVPSKAESKTSGISSTTRRPPKSKLPPEKGKDYLYTTPQEKEGIAKEIQQRPPQPYARVKNETFVNPPDKIPQPIPSAPSETSKLYDLLNIAFMKQVEENAKITKTINNITPEIQRTLNANIQPVGIGGRPPVIPYGHTEESWAAIDHKNRGKERIKSVNREKIDLFREANPDSTIQDDTILRNIRKQEKAEARTPADKKATVAEEERIYREKQNKEDQKDEDYIPSSKKEKRKKAKTGKKGRDLTKELEEAKVHKEDMVDPQGKEHKGPEEEANQWFDGKPPTEEEKQSIATHRNAPYGFSRGQAIAKIQELGFNGAFREMNGYGIGNTRLNGEVIYDEMEEDEIAKVMKLHEGVFCPVIAHDEINKIRMNPKKPTFWIQNTDNRGKDGTHWQAVWIDTHDICFYDSFGRDPDAETLENIKTLVGKDHHYLRKLKINKVQTQQVDSATCGWQCIEFLNKMLSGESFKKATKFETPEQGEHDVKELQKKWGYV